MHLTERQTRILSLIRLGYKEKEIAETLGLSKKTVEAHKTRLYTNIGAKNAPNAVYIAMKRGLLE